MELQRELVAVISKYVKVNPSDIKVIQGRRQSRNAGSQDRVARGALSPIANPRHHIAALCATARPRSLR